MGSRMIVRLGLALALALAAPAAAVAPRAITAEALARHVAVLADDAYEGRSPLNRTGPRPADYIARAFGEIGVEPVGGGTFLHPVPLVRARAASASVQIGAVVAGGREVMAATQQSVASVQVMGQLALAGAAEGDGRLAGVADRIVVARLGAGAPAAVVQTLFATARAARRSRARGFVGVLDATAESDAWNALAARIGEPATMLDDGRGFALVVVSRAAAARLFEAGELDGAPRDLGRDAALTIDTTIERFTSDNVIARLPGRGRRSGEHVLFTAHWDHLGRCAINAPDPICNGANDNASGTAALIEVARAFKRGRRPRRSILFIATTAEEDGFMGARHFISRPAVPLETIVGGFNFDTIAEGPEDGPITILGEGLTTLDPLIARAAAKQRRRVSPNPGVQSFFRRSDNWPFAQAGVPILALHSGFGEPDGPFATYLGARFHTPADEYRPGFDLTGAARDAELAQRVGLAIANARRRPEWLPGKRPEPPAP